MAKLPTMKTPGGAVGNADGALLLAVTGVTIIVAIWTSVAPPVLLLSNFW